MPFLSDRRKDHHFVSATIDGEKCHMCGWPASHQLAEIVPPDDPSNENTQTFPRSGRRPLTAHVCCHHFTELLGPATGCRS